MPNLWALNTPGGVVDLRNGAMCPRTHRQRGCDDPDSPQRRRAATAPRWRAFLGDVTGGDAELQAYLQRMAGLLPHRCDQMRTRCSSCTAPAPTVSRCS